MRSRRPACSIAAAAWAATSRRTALRESDGAPAVSRQIEDDDAGHRALAHDGLEQRRARAGGGDQRRGQRRMLGARRRRSSSPATRTRGRRRAGLLAGLDRHGRHLDAVHRGRGQLAAARLEQEGDRGAGGLAGRLEDRAARVAVGDQRAGRPRHGGHPARLRAQRVVQAPQVALLRLPFELVGEHAGEHREQLLVLGPEGVRLAGHRRQRADARAVRQLERRAEVGAGAEAALVGDAAVDGVRADVVAQPRRAVVGHVDVEGVRQRQRQVRAQAELAAVARVDDAVDVVAAVEVGEEDRHAGHLGGEEVQHGARRVRERAVLGRPTGRRPPGWRPGLHQWIIGHGRGAVVSRPCGWPPSPTRNRRGPRRRGPRRRGGRLRAGRHRPGPALRPARRPTAPSSRSADVTLLAPPRPRAIFGIGLNYAAHARETGRDLPEFPIVFMKLPSSSAAPNGDVTAPGGVLAAAGLRGRAGGRDGRGQPIAGYAIADDLSARDLQGREPQWTRAKGFDNCCPWGPWVTTADEVPDPRPSGSPPTSTASSARTRRRRDLVFGPEELVAFLAEAITLEPGDLILTGTPDGVGVAMDPRRFLERGDASASRSAGWGRSSTPCADAVAFCSPSRSWPLVGGADRAARPGLPRRPLERRAAADRDRRRRPHRSATRRRLPARRRRWRGDPVRVQNVRPRFASPELELIGPAKRRLRAAPALLPPRRRRPARGRHAARRAPAAILGLRAQRAGLYYALGLIVDYRRGQRRYRDRESQRCASRRAAGSAATSATAARGRRAWPRSAARRYPEARASAWTRRPTRSPATTGCASRCPTRRARSSTSPSSPSTATARASRSPRPSRTSCACRRTASRSCGCG